jgi:hypothetical protein
MQTEQLEQCSGSSWSSKHTSSYDGWTVVEEVECVAETISEPHHSCEWTVKVVGALEFCDYMLHVCPSLFFACVFILRKLDAEQ